MNWQQFIEQHCRHDEYELSAKFYPPSSDADIATIEAALSINLPTGLRDLLKQTNGVMELMRENDHWIEINWIVWSTVEIARENLNFRGNTLRAIYKRSFEDLLFFVNAGVDGILFACKIVAGQAHGSSIYAWYPIGDEVIQVAPTLEAFIEGWLTGRILI